MIKNYLKIAIRNLTKYKGFSFINTAGLAIGLACTILILLWVYDEISYDRFHKNADESYRIVLETQSPNNINRSANSPNALGPALKEQYPEIVNFTRYMGGFSGWLVRCGEKTFMNDRWAAADPSFFKIFSFPFIHGDPQTALKDRYSMVITEDMAKKYFGDNMPIGKVIQKDKTDLRVTGVIKIPHNSHIQFDYIFPIINMKEWFIQDLESWEPGPFKTYVQLSKNISSKEVNPKIAGIIKTHLANSNTTVHLQPFKKIHLYTDFQDDACNYHQGNVLYVYMFSSIALCILMIACINFMNLTTARSTSRAKEVSIRKVVGAKRKDIILQFWGEALLLTIIALLIAVVLVELLLPFFNNLTNKQLSIVFSSNIAIILGLLAISLLTALIAGSYPAIFLSSVLPLKVMKNSAITGTGVHSRLRRWLVMVQFTFAILLIITTTVIYNQLLFMKNKDLGYDKENVIYFYGHGKFFTNYESIRNELLNYPNIISVSKAFPPFYPGDEETSDIDWEGKNPNKDVLIRYKTVDYDYLKTFNMEMAQGRFFSKDFTSDLPNFILNETAVRTMGIENPIGRRLTYKGRSGRIIGVLKDFHQSSLHNKISPFIFSLYTGPCYICVKMNQVNIPGTLEFIEEKWTEYEPDRPFTYYFFDDMIADYYRTEQRLGTVTKYFTLFTVFVSCLGLFGLSSYAAVQRTKEIGIRKVLGASVSGIILLLSKDFTKWVLLANLIAWPIAYYAMNQWLQNFAYRIDIGWWTFLLAGALVLVIALLTVSYQAIRAATANPVKALRYE